MLKISYACCLDLGISVLQRLCRGNHSKRVRREAGKSKKITETVYIKGSKSFKVIDVDNP